MENTRENRSVAIKISGLKKQYRIGQIGGRTLQADLQSWWAKLRGREDPNTVIGQNQRLIGKSFMALNGIDLTVYKGEALGIIGSNGAGKSTMLKLLSRVTAPTEGEIDIYGRITSMLEVGTGFHREMTGRENVYMNGAILGMSRREIDEHMEEIIEFSEVWDFIDTPVKRYSSGMFVKLAFSVAAHLNSEIMIMDEVLAVGDMAFQKKCLDRMRQAANVEGRTVLYVSHNMNTIRRLCDRCIVLDQGKIIYDGDVEEAIRIYMDRSVGDSEVDMDLTKKSHVGKVEIDSGLRMEHLTILDKITPVFSSDDKMRLKFQINTTRILERVQLRLTFRTDTDVAIGTAWSEPINFTKTGTHQVVFSFPMTLLAKGVFYISIGFNCLDDLGRSLMLDHITRAFKIEVVPGVGSGNQFWSTNAYGYVKFPEIKQERQDRGQAFVLPEE